MKKLITLTAIIGTFMSTSVFANTANDTRSGFKSFSTEITQSTQDAIDTASALLAEFESLPTYKQKQTLPIYSHKYVRNSLELRSNEIIVVQTAEGYRGVVNLSFRYEIK
jgi:glutathionyl-hydroquinone reductase